jgi:hypothetical protein
MIPLGSSLSILVGLGGLLALFGLGTFLFQAGCALADVPERGYFRSLPIYAASLVLCLPLAALLIWFAGRYDANPDNWFGNARIAAAVAALLLTWLVSAGLYALLLAGSLRKGLMLAGFELLLMALVTALVSGVVFVVLALVQIGTRPPQQRVESGEWRVERKTHSLLSTFHSPLFTRLP